MRIGFGARALGIAVICMGVQTVAGTVFAAKVRTDRPRMLLSNGTGRGTSLATFKQRCTSDAAYKQRCQSALTAGGGLYPAINQAAGYLVNGDAARCTAAVTQLRTIAADTPGQPDAHSFISNNGRTMAQLAVVRDWCDGALSDPDKQWIEQRMVASADWYVANPPGDVFHDDMNNAWNAVALAGLALAGTAEDTKAQGYLTAADTQFKKVILPALAYSGDWWPEGMTYVQPSIGSLAWYATAWTVATDEDIYAYAKSSANDVLSGYLAFHAYALRPDYKYVYFGDTTDNKQSVELFSRWLVDMLDVGTQSPLGQGLSLAIRDHSRPGYDYAGADGYLIALLYDSSRDGSATDLSKLPTARWLGQKSNDIAVLRSGWGTDDTYVWLSCGDYLGPHQHDEAGAFQIFRSAPLTGSTGYYDNFDSDHWQNYYSQHSVHANTLAIYEPNEVFPTSGTLTGTSPNVNDGGERTLRRNKSGTGFPSTDLPTYLKDKTSGPLYETGDIKTFETTACEDYVACDVTAAYDSTGSVTNGNVAKVKEVTRQFVFVKPEIVVVFDRVEATDASYDKRFLLHAYATPTVNGSSFTLTNGTGRLYGQTLLPTTPDVNVVTNFEVAGTPHPPTTAGAESGGTRLEISPKTEALRDYFLHVFDATSASNNAAPTATLNEDASSAGATISAGGTTTEVRFTKTGALGGHIKVSRAGAVVCEQDLGQYAQSPDAGVPLGAGGSSGAGTGGANSKDGGAGAATSAKSSSGCGCQIAGGASSPGFWALALVAIAGCLRRRRFRRSPR